MAVRPHDGIRSDSRDALFLSERKERISNRTVQYIVKKELYKAGLDTNKYSVHKLRHTAATRMVEKGVDLVVIQQLLGHATITTTMRYTHALEELKVKAIEILSDY